jgi:NAD(P)-dependent dehydrogenase (short-subunit alcohol dehydrogenase family)
MPTVMITGCDTGLGREFALQYAQEGWNVWATYRDLANAPRDDRMRHAALDVTDLAQFAALRERVGSEPIDLLISNAGVGLDTGRLGALDHGHVDRMLAVNLVGALRLVDTFVDHVAASTRRRIVLITSRMGSIASNLSGGHYGYRASKAGLNAIGRSLAIDLFPRGITVAMIHPGWVATAGGGAGAPLTAAQSVASMRALVARLGNHETGVYLGHDGQPLPW